MGQKYPPTQRDRPSLKRELGLYAVIAIVMGNIIGSGIFFTPGELAAVAELEWQVYFFWALCGAITLCGALTLAEIATLLPRPGVSYHALNEGFGPFWGFMKAWMEILVSGPGAIAGVAILFGEFAAMASGSTEQGRPAIFWAIAAIVFFAIINLRGVRWGARTQIALTAVKVAGLAAFIVGALIWASPVEQVVAVPSAPSGGWGAFLRMVGLGVAAVLFSYDGWVDCSHLAGEVRDPRRTFPIGLGVGVACVTVIYLLVNLALLRVVPLTAMRDNPTTVASTVATAAFGESGGALLNLLILLSIFGALGGLVMSLPRMYYAATSEYRERSLGTFTAPFFRSISHLSPSGVPAGATLYASGAAILALVFFGSFSRIVTFFVVPLQVTNMMMVGAVIPLRRRLGNPNAYRAPGYPWLPFVYIAVLLGFVISALIYNPVDCLIGIGLTSLGAPVYWALFRESRRP